MGYCTICGKTATVGVYCENCAKMLEKRVNKGLVVTKAAITSHQDRRQASASSGSSRSSRPSRPTRPSINRPTPTGEGRISGKGIAIGKDGLPMYCDACGNLLYRDGAGYACKVCGRVEKNP